MQCTYYDTVWMYSRDSSIQYSIKNRTLLRLFIGNIRRKDVCEHQ